MRDFDADVQRLCDGVVLAIGNVSTEYVWCCGVRRIAADIGLPFEIARAVVRELRARGLVEYMRGLFTKDGKVAGSGYTLTPTGVARYRQLVGDAPDRGLT